MMVSVIAQSDGQSLASQIRLGLALRQRKVVLIQRTRWVASLNHCRRGALEYIFEYRVVIAIQSSRLIVMRLSHGPSLSLSSSKR